MILTLVPFKEALVTPKSCTSKNPKGPDIEG